MKERETMLTAVVMTTRENTERCHLCRSSITCEETSWVIKWPKSPVWYEHYCHCCYALLHDQPGFRALGFPPPEEGLSYRNTTSPHYTEYMQTIRKYCEKICNPLTGEDAALDACSDLGGFVYRHKSKWSTYVPARLLGAAEDRLRPFWPKREELKRFRKFNRAIKGGWR